MDTFNRPTDALSLQDNYSDREVGITHPDVSSFIKLRDNGDVEIVTGEGVGIIMNRNNKSISFFGDHIRFLTREDDTGMRWNKIAFNPKATSFNEPAFVVPAIDDMYNLYQDTDGYFGTDTTASTT